VNIGTNPLALIFPTVFASSLAFTLPIATPPNAIVFSYGMLRVVDMVNFTKKFLILKYKRKKKKKKKKKNHCFLFYFFSIPSIV